MKKIMVLLVFILVISMSSFSVNAITGDCPGGCGCYNNIACLGLFQETVCTPYSLAYCNSGYVCSVNACVQDTTYPNEHDLAANSRSVDSSSVTLIMTADDKGDGFGIEYYTLHRKQTDLDGSNPGVWLDWTSSGWTTGTPISILATGSASDNYKTTFTDTMPTIGKKYQYDAHVYDWVGHWNNNGAALTITYEPNCDGSLNACESSACKNSEWLGVHAVYAAVPSSAWASGTDSQCCGENRDALSEGEHVLDRQCYYNEVYGCTNECTGFGCGATPQLSFSLDKACVATIQAEIDNCVFRGVIYSKNSVINNPEYSSSVGKDKKMFCTSTQYTGAWADCDHGSLYCNGCGSWIIAGESGVGEYTDTVTSKCCGDDGSEFAVNKDCDGNTVTAKCCNSSTDVISDSGNCITTAECITCGAVGDSCSVDDDCC
ncbi:MAG: hypothetical protein ABIB43_06930, partial [archaeon]